MATSASGESFEAFMERRRERLSAAATPSPQQSQGFRPSTGGTETSGRRSRPGVAPEELLRRRAQEQRSALGIFDMEADGSERRPRAGPSRARSETLRQSRSSVQLSRPPPADAEPTSSAPRQRRKVQPPLPAHPPALSPARFDASVATPRKDSTHSFDFSIVSVSRFLQALNAAASSCNCGSSIFSLWS